MEEGVWWIRGKQKGQRFAQKRVQTFLELTQFLPPDSDCIVPRLWGMNVFCMLASHPLTNQMALGTVSLEL